MPIVDRHNKRRAKGLVLGVFVDIMTDFRLFGDAEQASLCLTLKTTVDLLIFGWWIIFILAIFHYIASKISQMYIFKCLLMFTAA